MRRQDRVLVISPNSTFREMTSTALAKGKLAVFCASERTQALQLMYRVRPSVILLQALVLTSHDWMLISDIRAFVDTPILVVSNSSDFDRARCSRMGRVYPCRGPVSCSELVNQVRQLVNAAKGSILALEPSGKRTRRDASVLPALRFLEPGHIRQLEHAVGEVGTRGEVRLVIRKGILRFLVECKTGRVPESF